VAGQPYILSFVPKQNGALSEVITIGYARDDATVPAPVVLDSHLRLTTGRVLGRASTMLDTTQTVDPRGVPLTFTLDRVPLVMD
jgi:hypothetical protein